MVKDLILKIIYLKSVDSTQTYLKQQILSGAVIKSLGVVADIQTNGVGSRNNTWQGLQGNLFFSFAIPLDDLAKDLKIESASIYFAQILKDILESMGSKIWLKWPNDFYIENKKIGGMMTNIIKNHLVCGIGLNLVASPKNFSVLDISIDKNELIKIYTKNIEKSFLWKQIFSKYKLNFHLSQKYNTHNNNLKISLENSILQDDGSVEINGERIYSSR
jgi:BirA family biotin operon repressor/biotin-[acetyl-CoA-carboxylase] ligase